MARPDDHDEYAAGGDGGGSSGGSSLDITKHQSTQSAGTSGSSKSFDERDPPFPAGDVDPLTCPPPPGMEDTPSAPPDRKKKLEKKEKKTSEKPALEFEAHAFRIVGDTKTLVVCADSAAEKEGWLADLTKYADENVKTTEELAAEAEQKRLEEIAAQKEREFQQKVVEANDVWITAPVAVKTVTGWYKLVGSKKGKSAVTGEVQLSFNVSRSGEDLGSTGPVNRLSLMYVTITVLSARGLRAVDTKKKTSDVMCVVKVGGVTRKTRVCKGTRDPVWIQQFEPMPFVAGFFTMIEVKLVHPHWMSHVNLGHVDIPMTQVLLLSDIEVEDQDPSSVNLKRVADKHATRRMRQSMANAAAMRLAAPLTSCHCSAHSPTAP